VPGEAVDPPVADEKLQQLTSRYEAILAAVPDIIVEVNRNKVYVWANPAALEFFGDDMLGKEAAYYFAGPQDTYEKVQSLFKGDESVFYLESWQRRRDGQKRLLGWWCRVLKDAAGNVVGALSTARDITERQQVVEALRRQLDELFAVFNGIDGAVYIADMQTHEVLAANEHVKRMCGADWQGKKCYELLQRSQSEACPACTNARLVGPDGAPAPPVLWEFQNPRTQRWYQCIDRAIRWSDGRLVRMEIALDITARKQAEQAREQLEARLRQAQKMEAFGQLAGGVAHDFNNILTAMMGNAEMLRGQLEQSAVAPHEWAAHLEQIDLAAQRAASLTRQLLAFTRQQATRQELLDVNRILADMRTMLGRLISENIVLELVLSDDLASVWADSGQVEQVVMNLVVNARDALPGGGRVVLETANVDLDATYVAAHPEARPGPYVKLAVRDNGCGMSAEVLSRIFEPFFTTKPVGQGTGLGLATVYGILRQAGGHVTVSSQPRGGSTFEVFWPAAAAHAVPHAMTRDESRGLHGGETVLVCEDDPAVRDLAVYFLRLAGYTVLAAENGQRALQAAAAHAGPIHLLVTDVIMPDLNGRQLADALTAVRPELKTLFMSGYTSNVIAHHGVRDMGLELLEKPFTRERLLRCVRTLLDPPQPAARPA
jgi:PAS domain S-box-containing protein